MVAEQIAPPPARLEAAHVDAGSVKRIEEVMRGGMLAAESVDDQLDAHPAPGRIDQGIAHREPGRIVDIDVVEHPKRPRRRVDQAEERFHPPGPLGQHRQAIAVDSEGLRPAIHDAVMGCAAACGKGDGLQRSHVSAVPPGR